MKLNINLESLRFSLDGIRDIEEDLNHNRVTLGTRTYYGAISILRPIARVGVLFARSLNLLNFCSSNPLWVRGALLLSTAMRLLLSPLSIAANGIAYVLGLSLIMPETCQKYSMIGQGLLVAVEAKWDLWEAKLDRDSKEAANQEMRVRGFNRVSHVIPFDEEEESKAVLHFQDSFNGIGNNQISPCSFGA